MRFNIRRSLFLEVSLGLQALELHVRVIDEVHGAGDGAVARFVCDRAVHQLAHAAVRRMALGRCPQLDQVHRFPRVHVHVEPHAVGHHHGVRGGLVQPVRAHLLVQIRGLVHHDAPLGERTGVLDRFGFRVAVTGAERLPVQRQQAVSLQIAEGAVVGEHVEAIAGAFERASRLVAAIGAVADVGAQQGRAIVRRQACGDRAQLVVGQCRHGVQRRGHDVRFAIRVEVGQRHLGFRLRVHVLDERARGRVEVAPRVREVLDPASSAVGLIQPRQERRDHVAQFCEHLARAAAHFVERMREHPQQQRFERLTRPEQADVRSRRGGQQPSQRVERLCANDRAIDGVGVVGRFRVPGAEVRLHRRDPLRVGVERGVERVREAIAER